MYIRSTIISKQPQSIARGGSRSAMDPTKGQFWARSVGPEIDLRIYEAVCITKNRQFFGKGGTPKNSIFSNIYKYKKD